MQTRPHAEPLEHVGVSNHEHEHHRAALDRRDHRHPFDLKAGSPKVNDYRTEKLRELDQLAADADADLEDVRRARRIALRLRSPRLSPLGARRALFDARAVSTRLRRVHDLGKEKTQ